MPNLNVEEFCNRAFAVFDMDNDGLVGLKEFLLTANFGSDGTVEEQLKSVCALKLCRPSDYEKIEAMGLWISNIAMYKYDTN